MKYGKIVFVLLALTGCIEGTDEMNQWEQFSGNMGRSINVPISPILTDRSLEFPDGHFRTVMEVRTPDDIGQTFTVTLTAPEITDAAFRPRYLCLIERGAGGTSDKAVIDWLQGTTFTVSGSFVRVSALYMFLGVAPPASLATVKLGAFLGLGSGYNVAPQRSLIFQGDTDTLIAAASGLINVPSYAVALTVLSFRDPPAAPLPQGVFTLAQIGISGGPVGVYQIGASTLLQNMGISNETKQLRITNDDPVITAHFTVVYTMAL